LISNWHAGCVEKMVIDRLFTLTIESFIKGAKPYLLCQNEQALELRKQIIGNKDGTLIGIS